MSQSVVVMQKQTRWQKHDPRRRSPLFRRFRSPARQINWLSIHKRRKK